MNHKLLIAIVFFQQLATAQMGEVHGTVKNSEGSPVAFATITLKNSMIGTAANGNGEFTLGNIPTGNQTLQASAIGHKTEFKEVVVGPGESLELNFQLVEGVDLNGVEVFGSRYERPDKIEALTGLPMAPYDQIQSISIISDKLIEQQGNLTIADATRNVPGVYTFATYGNKRESMSSRGFRGIPILKNGVRVNSDFRGVGILTDMQGVDNIQVLKGSASITQGVATDLGSPGGVVNIVTKTPRNYHGGQVSLRAGTYGQLRTTYDVYGPLNDKKNIAFRINGALERADSYRAGISSNRFYINPSMEWNIDDNSSLILEMDYLDDSRTPDLGTVNLAENDVNAIYDLPYDQFLGYTNDKSLTKNMTYAIRFNRRLSDKLNLRAAFFSSKLDLNDKGASLGGPIMDGQGDPIYNERKRGYSISTRNDDNKVLQFDLNGDNIKTGNIGHTFQIGFDYRTTNYATFSQSNPVLDSINVFATIDHNLPTELGLNGPNEAEASSRSVGLVAQDVITFNTWLKTFLGLRYSSTETIGKTETTRNDSFNPLIGLIATPYRNINVFASYTNSSYPRTATRLDVNGDPLGNERFDQLEAGIKTNWLESRLRFNLTFFQINNKNINLPVYDENWVPTGYYQKGGNDERKGIEVELTGRVLENLELITGYSYINAQYKEHTSYVYGSSPLNTPDHTFNVWANYGFRGKLQGLSFGTGAYYTGKRPINDWSAGPVTHEGIVPGQKPFDVDAYTIVNAQLAYRLNARWNFRALLNNMFNEIGYNAYRTAYINQTEPINFAGIVSYSF